MTIKSLPLSYNKDLQEAVEPLLEQMTTVRDSIRIAGRVLDTLTVFPDRMRAALTTDMLATDLAEYLVDRGIPFRETHDIAGQVVALAEKQGRPMDKLSLDELREVDSRFESDVSSVWEFETSVERKDSDGGTSKRAVLEQIKELWKIINSERWIRQSDAEPDKE